MSCYASHRPVYCYILWSPYPAKLEGVLPLPVVVGPFKTKTGATNAFHTDYPEGLPEGVHSRIQQMIPYYTPQGHLASLHFDQFIDPKVAIRPAKTKKGAEPVDTGRTTGDGEDGGSEHGGDNPEEHTVHLVPG